MGVKQCELCELPARMHCESDQASLCWDCDAKVHGANFLVARHSRRLLCRSCQLPTPWKAEGVRLGPTVSLCERCAAAEGEEDGDRGGGGRGCAGGSEEEEGDAGGGEMDEDEGEGNENEEEEEEDDDGENQVVPWSLTPPPPVASSSSGEECDGIRNGGGFLKRMQENADLAVSQENLACSSSRPSYPASDCSPTPAPAAEDEATSFASDLRPSKNPAAGSAVLDLRLVSRPKRYKNPEA